VKGFDVVGGFYQERCRLPDNSDETWGSGGRAAAIIAGFGFEVTLHTALSKESASLLASLAHTFGFKTVTTEVATTQQFHYDHGLSSPLFWPPTPPQKIPIKVTAPNVLVFGMLEGEPEVQAERIIYDPQNPLAPQPLLSHGVASRIAYVLNGTEARKLSRLNDPYEAAKAIATAFKAEVVVIKLGPKGALVFEAGQYSEIPAYWTQRVWPIGSGDVFAATFAANWAEEGMTAREAAGRASRAAALYGNDRVLPISAEAIAESVKFEFDALHVRESNLGEGNFHVYLAGPFFSIAQRWLVEEARLALSGFGLRVFSPLHDVGIGHARDVAPKDVDAIRKSRVMLALLDGLDSGTIFEVGYARSLEKPVIGLAEATPEEPLKMLTGTDCDIVNDFVTAIYRVVWAALA
jgi:nucleoside 2-deoxyribosyltransferase